VALDLALAALTETTEMPFAEAGRWRVVGSSDGIEVRAAVNVHLPVAAQRLTRVAAGPALLAVRLAIAVSGFRPFTTSLPDPQRPRVLAVVRCGAARAPSQAERALFAELVNAPREQEGESRSDGLRVVLPLLRRAADAEGVWMRTVSAPGDRRRLLAGQPTVPAVPGAGEQPLLLVIGSYGGLPSGDLHAGQAMQRALLTARSFGLRATVLAGPTGLATLWRRIGVPDSSPGLLPQVVLQVGAPSVGLSE